MAAPATTKHIFVTGGVASSIGKGLTASGLGHLLRSRGLRVTMQKLDPYLNVDPGTMNPFQSTSRKGRLSRLTTYASRPSACSTLGMS